MKNLNAFLMYVMPYARGCPQVVARQAILDSAIEFCEMSGAIQQTLDPVTAVAGVTEYDLPLPTRQDLVQVKRAWYKDSELVPAALDAIRTAQAWRNSIPGVEATTGEPREFYTVNRSSIGLYPKPRTTEANVITVRVALKPARTATQLEDELFDDWVEVIAAGALYRLHSAPGEPYTDTAKAADRDRQFRAGVNKGKLLVNTGRVRGELSVQMRPFA